MRAHRHSSLLTAATAVLTTIAFTIASLGAIPSERSSATAAAPSPAPGSKAVSPKAQSMGSMMQMPMVFPLFLQNQDFSSTLVLTNALAESTYADVILKATSGTEITRQRIEFTAHSQRAVEVQSLLMSAVSPATTGSITVVQQSPELDGTMAILGQLSMTYRASEQPNYIDEEIAMPSAQGSQILRAVADSGEGSPLVAITNLSESGQHIAIQCLAEKSKNLSKSVDLLAGETLLTEACSERTVHGAVIESFSSTDSQSPRGPIGVSLTTDGMPGSFAAFGLVRHKKGENQSFSNITFTDPKMLLSPTTIFAGAPVGSASLLAPGKYVPELSLTNFSTKDLQVHVQYSQTSGTAPATKELAALTIAAGTSREITFDDLQGDPQLQNSFLVTSDGAPGDVLAKLISRNDSAPGAVELLGKDAQDTNNGGSNPWSIEQGAQSTLLFFNHDQAPQIFNVLIASADGSQWDKDFKLAPMETRAISIGDIIQKQVKDDKGKTLPAKAVSGQISWWTVGTASGPGTGRLLQSNRASGMARSFACGCPYILCGAIFNVDASSIVKGQTAAPLDDLTPEICMYKVGSHCSGLPESYTSSQALSYYWYSSNTAILQISGSSTDSYVNGYGAGVGTATMTGRVSATYYGPPMTCQFSGSAQHTVTGPPDHLVVVVDQQGASASCPSTGIQLRQMQMRVVDVNGTTVPNGPSVAETQNPAQPVSSCGPGSPVPASCAPTASNSTFIDNMAVSGNLCNSGIKRSSGCGFTVTSTWSACATSGSNTLWVSPRTTKSNLVTVDGNSSSFNAGTICNSTGCH